jgi:hypothetical protein
MFAHSIKTNRRAPVDLRSQINLPAPEDDLEKQVEQTVNVYNLRRGRTLVKNIIPETKYETLTFKHFFPRLLSFYKHLDFSVRKYSFRLQINLNLNENLKIFMIKFPKFKNLYRKIGIFQDLSFSCKNIETADPVSFFFCNFEIY